MSVATLAAPDPGWRDRLLLIATGAAVFLVVLIAVCRPWDLENAFMIGAPFGRDFANFWLGGHLAATGKLDLLIDLPAYNALFSQTFRHNPAEWFVYSYPPHSLLVLAPFGALPFLPANVLWTALNLACVVGAARLISTQWRWAVIAIVSPAVLTMVAFGHFGGALALLATYALLRADQRPALAGICLALATVKPQFALVVGALLVFTGRWRAVAWSVPATLVLVAASIAAFGMTPWVNFVQWTVPFHARMLSDFNIEALRTTISLYAGARMVGAPSWAAQAMQYGFSLVVLWRAAQVCRRDGANARTIALALLAALSALPYFNGYDLAIAAPALTLALFADRREPPFLTFVPAILLWLAPVFALPFGLLALPIVPFGVAAIVLLALFPSPLAKKVSLSRSAQPAAGNRTAV